MDISRERGNLSCSSGLGVHFTSPTKARNPKRKTQTQASSTLDPLSKRHRLETKLAQLLAPSTLNDQAIPAGFQDLVAVDSECAEAWEGSENFPGDQGYNIEAPNDPFTSSDTVCSTDSLKIGSGNTRRLTPNQAAINLYAKWQATVPTLVDDILSYYSSSVGRKIKPVNGLVEEGCPSCICVEFKSLNVLVLYFDHFSTITLTHCSCRSTSQVLVKAGLFPTAPSQTRMAVSIDFLDFYSALFERSCDAVNALAAAMNNFYGRRGFQLLNRNDEKYREPFRRGLGYAAQWLDMVHVAVEKRLDSVLAEADEAIQKRRGFSVGQEKIDIQASSSSLSIPSQPQLTECARILQRLCPACFACSTFGRCLEEGGDFQICTDGNFHHRHLVSGGQGIPFHDAKHVIPKSFVDEVGNHIEKVRKSRPKSRRAKVPDEALDECQNSYEAADGDKKKASGGFRYDSQGWMSLICRHDIPLFVANIDTPGEQQKYAVALIRWFYALLPPTATATVLYDIGCLLDRSVQLYDILPQSILSRIRFATTALHAYGHQWACQLEYNPRLLKGLGLSDGEGVERTWSKLRKLIVVVRSSLLARRLWLTDRQLSSIAGEMRDGLGDWILNRLRRGVKEQGERAQRIMDECGIPTSELQTQWKLQKHAQLSIRAHAPTRLKKELDTVLTLQAELDDIEKVIQTAKSALSTAPKKSTKIVKRLLETHQDLTNTVEALYVSLDIQESFPDLDGVDLEFVRTLLMARDLKINIRKRAIGSFFEWDRLDQAVGGRNQALGTKLHQHTRKAISKRQPALLNAIRKFNQYCSRLEELYDPSCRIPLPSPLPTKLADLRDNSNLMEDIWITPTTGGPPALWLEDRDVRTGIQAMLKVDRCLEERRRLGWEADNLCQWFGRELAAVELALRRSKNAPLLTQLSQYRSHLLHLKGRWTNPMASSIRFETHINDARHNAEQMTASCPPPALSWMNTTADVGENPQLEGPLSYVFVDEVVDSTADEDLDAGNHQSHDTTDPSDILISDDFAHESNVDGLEDTSVFAYLEGTVRLIWRVEDLSCDNQLVFDFENTVLPQPSEKLYSTRTFGRFDFEESDLRRLDLPHALLNDICVNGIAHFLQEIYKCDPTHHHQSQRCAIFSTHDLVRIRYKASDENLWRAVSKIKYWEKMIWIFPIHRPQENHWVLAVVYVLEGQILVYDSLASRKHWLKDIEDISILIRRISSLAQTRGHCIPVLPQRWSAQPTVKRAVQFNNHDCGLWVLAWIAATLRGYFSVGSNFKETHICNWRSFLAQLVRTLPLRLPVK